VQAKLAGGLHQIPALFRETDGLALELFRGLFREFSALFHAVPRKAERLSFSRLGTWQQCTA
jgi:hypothetical protein